LAGSLVAMDYRRKIRELILIDHRIEDTGGEQHQKWSQWSDKPSFQTAVTDADYDSWNLTSSLETLMKRLVLSLAGMTLLAAMQESSAADLKVGDEAPAFELKGSDGKTYKLSDFKGKQAVVVAWYPKAFTGG